MEPPQRGCPILPDRGEILEDTPGRILSRRHTFTDSIIPNPNKTQFRYGFDWVPDGTGIWPVSIPPVAG